MNGGYNRNLVFLLLLAAVVLAAGLGLRDPWPADEPRFALIARDMAESGNWLIPRVGGVLYPDKPPLFFWLVAAIYAVTGSIRVSLLVPGIAAGLGTLYLVTDLGRRLWGPRTAIWCGATLLAMVQFPLQMKSGQIDGFLCLLTTLGLYGLLRHLLLGPDWRWYAAGGFFAGVGVITKGVGFLPFLVFLPYVLAARAGWPVCRHTWRDGRWLLAPAAFLLPVAAWLLPMLLATAGGAEFAAYRDNILFHQTITRYADSWGHIKPAWYLLTNAVPWLWLPASFLVPWLAPAWWRDLRERNPAVLLLGAWVLLVLLFFSLSTGKRSLYIFPAAPAFALLVGLHAETLFRRVGVQRLFVALPAVIGALVLVAGGYALTHPNDLGDWITDHLVVIRVSVTVMAIGLAMLTFVAVCRRRRVLTGFAAAMAAFWLGLSLLVAPAIDGTRSGANLVAAVDRQVDGSEELGFVAWPEQFLLQWQRAAFHFGFRRDPAEDARDGAAWLAQSDDREVLLPSDLLVPCFDPARVRPVGRAHRRDWVLAGRDALTTACPGGGAGPAVLVRYAPPAAAPVEYVLADGRDDGRPAAD